jgi:toxin CcdB
MAQFDVYPNPNRDVADDMPYVLDVQADFLADLPTRILVPLVRPQVMKPSPHLNPMVRVAEEDLVVMTNHLVSLPTALLGKPVASVRDRRYDLIAALDFLFTGI